MLLAFKQVLLLCFLSMLCTVSVAQNVIPFIGNMTSTEKIIANLRSEKKIDVRIFPFGFGYDVNTTLLDRLGSENDGISDYVQPKEDLEVKVSSFFQRVSSPVLADMELDWGAVLTEYTYPRKLTDLFRGMQMTIIGRYKNTNDLKDISERFLGVVKEFTGKPFPEDVFEQLEIAIKAGAQTLDLKLRVVAASQRVNVNDQQNGIVVGTDPTANA